MSAIDGPPLNPAVEAVWQLAAREAGEILHRRFIENEHLFLGMLKLAAAAPPALVADTDWAHTAACLRLCCPDADRWRRGLRARLGRGGEGRGGHTMHRSPACRETFAAAARLAERRGAAALGVSHLLESLLAEEEGETARFIRDNGGDPRLLAQWLRAGPTAQGVSAPSSPLPEYAARDLTALAAAGKLDPVIGRRREIIALARVLARKKKNNAILIGDPGVGKTAVVEGLAQALVSAELPGEFQGWRLLEVRMADLLAGARLRGDLEERLQRLLADTRKDPRLLVFIDEIHTLMAGGGGPGPADILKPALQNGDFRCIGATTCEEFRRCIEPDAALLRRFQPLPVEEPDREQTMEILTAARPAYEAHHGVTIGDDLLRAVVHYAERYLPEQRFPDKALDLLDEALATARIDSTGPAVAAAPTEEHAARAVARRAGIPPALVRRTWREAVGELARRWQTEIYGQAVAARTVGAVLEQALGMEGPENKPLAVFLFVGPSGTGKTAAARLIADVLRPERRDGLIVFDMSEFQQEHSVYRLIGAPPGYVGFGSGGQLVEAVRRNPFAVVLFDEVEKAHPRVFDLFLQIFDEARLSDGVGRRADFRRTVIVLTANPGGEPGAARVKPAVGFHDPIAAAPADEERELLQAVTRRFRPEILARLPHQVVFRPLGPDDLHALLRERLLPEAAARFPGIDLQVEEAAHAWLVQRCDPRLGVRRLQQLIEKEIVQPLFQRMARGEEAAGARCVVRVGPQGLVVN